MTTQLILPEVLDLPAAATLADRFREASGSLLLDGSIVERIGTPALQLLLSVQTRAEARGSSFIIERPSASLQSAAATIGAMRLLTSMD